MAKSNSYQEKTFQEQYISTLENIQKYFQSYIQLMGTLEERDAEIKALEGRIESKDEVIGIQTRELGKQDKIIADLGEQKSQLVKQLEDWRKIYDSDMKKKEEEIERLKKELELVGDEYLKETLMVNH